MKLKTGESVFLTWLGLARPETSDSARQQGSDWRRAPRLYSGGAGGRAGQSPVPRCRRSAAMAPRPGLVMAGFLALLLILIYVCRLDAVQHSPKIQVYSRHPAENGKPNFLNCYVSGFHPPEIEIDLLKNGKEMKAEQTDLSFSKDWTFYLLVHTEFTPNEQDEFSCRVKHVTLSEPQIVKWDRDN